MCQFLWHRDRKIGLFVLQHSENRDQRWLNGFKDEMLRDRLIPATTFVDDALLCASENYYHF